MRLFLAAALLANAGEVAVVLGSDLRPYQEALEGFREGFGGEFAELGLSEPLPPETRVVVAIGGKAAARSLPRGVALVYCLAPGIQLPPPAARVVMLPRAGQLLARIRRHWPGLRRLGVLTGSPSYASYARELEDAAAAEDVAVIHERVGSPREVPGKLRVLVRKVDALWVPPDPRVLDAGSLTALQTFSWDNDVPLFVSSPGLSERGAVASIHVPYRALGRTAALAAREALAGRVRSRYFADEIVETSNPEAARQTGLEQP